MSSEVLIRLSGVHKRFPVFEKPYEALLHAIAPRLGTGGQFHALKGIDLEIRSGESIGVIGRNGSGKSTLLQLIAGILQPSEGRIEVSARIAALLELGAGFNPEFTGRENIRLNASLLGLSSEQIDERMDRIVAFAEIGDHLGQPVKTYSSGMFLRLAFAVAVHTDPDVLIVDEALSVGDVYFQRKCFRRIEQMRESGCTLLFVTHSVDTVLQLCDRGVVLEAGRLIFDGDAHNAVKAYLRTVFGDNPGSVTPVEQEVGDDEGDPAGTADAGDADDARHLAEFQAAGAADLFHTRSGYNRDETRLGDGRASTCDFLVSSRLGQGSMLPAREPFRVLVRYHFPVPLQRLVFGVRVCLPTGQMVYSANTLMGDGRLRSCEAGTTLVGTFDMRCSLHPGSYFLTVGVSRLDEDGHEIHAVDRRVDAVVLTVTGKGGTSDGIVDLEYCFGFDAVSGRIEESE